MTIAFVYRGRVAECQGLPVLCFAPIQEAETFNANLQKRSRKWDLWQDMVKRKCTEILCLQSYLKAILSRDIQAELWRWRIMSWVMDTQNIEKFRQTKCSFALLPQPQVATRWRQLAHWRLRTPSLDVRLSKWSSCFHRFRVWISAWHLCHILCWLKDFGKSRNLFYTCKNCQNFDSASGWYYVRSMHRRKYINIYFIIFIERYFMI